MFNMTRIRASNAAGKSFYANHLASNDYYSEHEKVVGFWRGTLADDFQLSGKDVTQSVFSAFQQNIDPVSGKKLTARNVENSVRFYDFSVRHRSRFRSCRCSMNGWKKPIRGRSSWR